jgi:hypothetical protein
VGAPSIYELDSELLQRIEEISSLCERIERAVDALIDRHGIRSETLTSAQALQTSVVALKRELLQHYLEYRIADAARAPGCQNN